MAEYIDREAFLKAKREQYCADCDRRKNSKGKMVYDIGDAPCRACSIDDILCDVEAFPVADVVERKRGKWKYQSMVHESGIKASGVKCSICGAIYNLSITLPDMMVEALNYCPNCGAGMDGETE